MSDEAVHRRAAKVNASMAALIDNLKLGPYRSWVPTVVFYAVVHVVDAAWYARSPGDCAGGHDIRRGVVRKLGGRQASADYQLLRDLTEHWRYDGQAPTEAEIAEAWRLAEAIAGAIGESWPP